MLGFIWVCGSSSLLWCAIRVKMNSINGFQKGSRIFLRVKLRVAIWSYLQLGRFLSRQIDFISSFVYLAYEQFVCCIFILLLSFLLHEFLFFVMLLYYDVKCSFEICNISYCKIINFMVLFLLNWFWHVTVEVEVFLFSTKCVASTYLGIFLVNVW